MLKNFAILIATLAALALGYIAFKKYKSPGPSKTVKVNLNQSLKQELDALASESLDKFRAEVFKRGREKQENLDGVLHSYITTDKSTLVRATAAEVISFFATPVADDGIEKALDDPAKNVRIAALRGIARNPTPQRNNAVLKHVNDQSIDEAEQIEIYSSLSRSGGEENKALAMEWLLYFSKKGDSFTHNTALFRAAMADPENKKLVEHLHERVNELEGENLTDTKTRAAIFAIQHLSALKDPWINDKYPALSLHPDPEIRAIVIMSLPRSCPRGMWKIIVNRVKNEKVLKVWHAILDAPKMILGRKSKLFVRNLIKQNRVPVPLIKKAKENLKYISENEKSISCPDQ